MKYWLVKSEPGSYSWDDLIKDTWTHWDGVRNYQARNNLKEMKIGDQVLFYHSVSDKMVVGVAKILKEYYPDPTAEDKRWVAVKIEPIVKLKVSVGLGEIKNEPRLQNIALVKQSRLSVIPLTSDEFQKIIEMGKGLDN